MIMHDTFFFTDIHGQYEVYQAIKQFCLSDLDNTIIYGGDACDRGPNGYQIMKDMLACPQIIYLKGNHEEMFTSAARALLKLEYKNLYTWDKQQIIDAINSSPNYDIQLAKINGGTQILVDWVLDGTNLEFLDRIEQLPLIYSYNNFDFSHSCISVKAFNHIKDCMYYNLLPNPLAIETCLWSRDYFAIGWRQERINVHGHTPTILLPEKIYKHSQNTIVPCYWTGLTAKREYPGARLDMDTGSVWSGYTYVLNCTTSKIIEFFNPSKKNMPGPIIYHEKFKLSNNGLEGT